MSSPLREKQAFPDVQTGALEECDDIATDNIPKEVFEPGEREYKIVWHKMMLFIASHCFGLYGIYIAFTSAMWKTLLFGFFAYILSILGITVGAHRLWSHRSFKAKWPLKLLLVFLQTLAHQGTAIWWARDHRLHHKFQGTNADPYNIKRGFFFSHCGWLFCRKHPEVIIKGKTFDVSDLYAEPLLRFQHKYFLILMPIVCFMLPTAIPMVLWNETFINAFCINALRYVCSSHSIFLVNSAAHMWGFKPYDKYINSNDGRLLSLFTLGEGSHNYHHTFPWDYQTSEIGRFTDLTMNMIKFFAKIGWAYDLKTVSPEMVKARVQRTGDGNHEIWGWGDKDQTPENYKCAVIDKKSD